MDIRRNYELGFHITPNTNEENIAKISGELKDHLVKAGSTITFAREPERTRLSYPIGHAATSFFGYIQFSTENPEGLSELEEYIKLNHDIMRHLMIRLPSDAQKNQAIMRQAKARERMERKSRPTPAKPAAPTDAAAMEKELEDVIGKL